MERIIESLQILQFWLKLLFWKNQCCYSEMVGSWLLLKSTSWHQCNTCVLQHLQTIEKIWSLALCCLLNFLRQFYLRESIHGSFNFIASDVLHSSQKVCNQTSSFLQWFEQSLVLWLEADSCWFLDIRSQWRVAHEINHQLTHRVWA